MAGETTYALIQSWVPDIIEATEMHLMQSTIMPALVQTFSDRTGREARRGDKYGAGTVGTVAETDALTSYQEFARTPFGTITPAEVGNTYNISDARLESDNVPSIMADLVESNGYTFAKRVDSDLLSTFANFTGGTVGTAGSALTWDTIAKAEAVAVQMGIPGPYNVVLHPYAYLQLAISRTNTLPVNVDEALRNANQFYLATFGGMNLYRAPLLTAGTAVTQALFSRRAIALDVRRSLRVEPQRNASKRSTEVITTMVYGYTAWRKEYGIKIISDASTPS
jgi:hypothetical protein